MRHEDLADADCGIAQTLGVVGGWWSWLIVRDVAGGLTRFDRLQSSLGISRRALSECLAELVDQGLLAKRAYSERPPRFDYVLTARGEGLLPVLLAMQEFGDRYVLGDGSVTATAGPGSPEAQRVHALVGHDMPSIRLSSHVGGDIGLTDGRLRLYYLFPGAFAPDAQGYPPGWGDIPGAAGCTLESTTYADRHAAFAALGCEVFGVSTQRPDQQAAFAKHAALPFTLLSDQDGLLASSLRLPMFRVAGADRFKRQSLLVGSDNVIRFVQMPITDPAGSVDEMLTAVGSGAFA